MPAQATGVYGGQPIATRSSLFTWGGRRPDASARTSTPPTGQGARDGPGTLFRGTEAITRNVPRGAGGGTCLRLRPTTDPRSPSAQSTTPRCGARDCEHRRRDRR
eukprot:8141220-Pyramimonas_sp.AAC.2